MFSADLTLNTSFSKILKSFREQFHNWDYFLITGKKGTGKDFFCESL